MAREFEAWIYTWQGAFDLLVQYQILWSQAKFTLSELGRRHQYPKEDLDAYVKLFHEKALDCCNPVMEDVRCLPPWNDLKITGSTLRIYHFSHSHG